MVHPTTSLCRLRVRHFSPRMQRTSKAMDAIELGEPNRIVHVMTRRKFLGTTIAGSATVLAGTVFQKLALAVTTSATQSTFELGGDLSVNRLGFGAMRLTGQGIWGWPPDRENAKKVLRRALDLGVNLIDTADAYGPETDELLIAEALYPYPKGLVKAIKGGNTRPGPGQWVPNGRPEYLSQCVDKSLKRLRLERIDLYQLHRIDSQVPMEDSLGALKKAQDAGKIRHVGLSEVSPEEIERARKVLPIATVQNQYNIDNRKWENRSEEHTSELQSLAYLVCRLLLE